MAAPNRPIDEVDFTRHVSERVHADAAGDPDLEAIDDDADELFNRYQLSHAKVERQLRAKYDAPRPAERADLRETVDTADRLAVRVLTHDHIQARHRVIVGDCDEEGETWSVATLTDPTIYSWPRGEPERLEVLTETHSDYGGAVPPLVELADFDTFEVYVARGHRLRDRRHYGPKSYWGAVVDAVADPDEGDLEALADEVSLGGDR
jgi:hypothetical protein